MTLNKSNLKIDEISNFWSFHSNKCFTVRLVSNLLHSWLGLGLGFSLQAVGRENSNAQGCRERSKCARENQILEAEEPHKAPRKLQRVVFALFARPLPHKLLKPRLIKTKVICKEAQETTSSRKGLCEFVHPVKCIIHRECSLLRKCLCRENQQKWEERRTVRVIFESRRRCFFFVFSCCH